MKNSLRRFGSLALLAASVLGLHRYLSAQASAPPAAAVESSAAPPVFRSRSDLVLVPVVVLRHGEHVGGLNKESFRLEQNGAEQNIASVEEIRVQGTAAAMVAPADGSYSNLPLDPAGQPRVTIILLDLLTTSQFQRTDAKEQLMKFLSRDSKSQDPISLFCITGKGLRSVLPFSSDRKVLIEALRKLDTTGYWLGHGVEVSTIQVLEALQQIARGYAGVSGRKTLLLTTTALRYPAVGELPGANGYEAPDEIRRDFDDTRRALLSSNIAVYPVELLGGDPARIYTSAQGLLYLAEGTGGSLCGASNDYSSCLNNAMEDSRSYYMLTYMVKPDDRKPGWRDLKVKLKGVEGEVRARSGFYYEDHSTKPSPDVNHKEEINALASPLDATGVLMSVRLLSLDAAPDGKKNAQFLITVPLQSIDVGAGGEYAVDLDTGGIALDKNTKEVGEFLRPLKGNPPSDVLQKLSREGIRLHASFALTAGMYDVRFFVRDNANGHIGTVVVPVQVR